MSKQTKLATFGAIVLVIAAVAANRFLFSEKADTAVHSTPNDMPKSAAENNESKQAQANEQAPLWMNAFNELYGKADPSGKTTTADKALSSVWFEQDFQYAQDTFHVVFIKTQTVDDNGVIDDCHSCGTPIGAVTYKQAKNTWQLVAKQHKLAEVGAYGDAPTLTNAESLLLTPDKLAFLMDSGYSGQGETDSGKVIFVFAESKWHDLGFILTNSDNSGDCGEDSGGNKPCFIFEGKISVAAGIKAYPDLLVTKTGTEMDDNGNVVLARNDVYAFKGNKYEQVTNSTSFSGVATRQ